MPQMHGHLLSIFGLFTLLWYGGNDRVVKEDKSAHASSFVPVNGVKLHYLDWGGHGETLLFLTGLGDSAHVFDDIAPKFTDGFKSWD